MQTASPLPLVMGVTALGSSVVVLVVALLTASAQVDLGGVSLTLVTTENWWLSLIGYLLTPIVVIGAYGWDALAQRDGLRRNPNGFVVKPVYSRVLLWSVAVGILLGAWHVLNLSVPISEVLR